ncbi:MAG TPA: SRPBCC family protein [Candidatus Methylacidiphilales bacterium]|nr:SRPBCC family protein [Candidatus Methylacidiphilales bacterium]
MRTSNVITIHAPLEPIFAAASDLARWPDFLSHYRYNRFLSPMPWGGIVKMSAMRSFIPTTWISVYRIDTERCQLHFEHLRSAFNATRGMIVVWHFTETPEGVRVEITHDLDLRWPLIGGLVGKYIVGLFFIHHIANRTLAGLKRKVENNPA